MRGSENQKVTFRRNRSSNQSEQLADTAVALSARPRARRSQDARGPAAQPGADRQNHSDFDVWCRRVTPCAPFIDALHRESVTLDKSPILEVTEDGIVTAEGLKKVDRIILATGFDTLFRPRYPIEAKGKSLGDVWAKRPKCACGVRCCASSRRSP